MAARRGELLLDAGAFGGSVGQRAGAIVDARAFLRQDALRLAQFAFDLHALGDRLLQLAADGGGLGAQAVAFDGGLLRASALLYLAQNLSLKDWLIYSQIAGMPLRVARYEPGTPEADRAALLKMLEKLGTDAVAVISRQAELSLLEPRGGEKPYQAIQDYCNTEVTILWLGQHLTTDVRTSGSRAAAEIHDRVREDLLVGDIAEEAATIRRDLLTPLTRARFGEAAPVPMLRRSLMQSVDTRVLAETLSRAVRELGLRVPKRWAHRALGIPEPRADEAVLAEGGQA